jgi:Uma2 family endonuclease
MAVEFHQPARPFTYDDLEDMPDDGYRREIIDGSLIVTPAPFGRHQRAVAKLVLILGGAETSDTMVIVAPYDWKLPNGDSVQPDVVVIRRHDFAPDGPLPPTAVPLLVIEVLSSNAMQDLAVKRELYERFAVPQYWIVDPKGPSLLALRLAGNSYEVEAELGADDVLLTERPFVVTVNVADLIQ